MPGHEQGGYEPPIFNTEAGREFRGRLEYLESHAELDVRNVFRHSYHSGDTMTTLAVYVDEPSLPTDGDQQDRGNISFEFEDFVGGHYMVGEEGPERETEAWMLFEKVVANQTHQTELWLRILYGAIDREDEGIVARQSLQHPPDTIDTVFHTTFQQGLPDDPHLLLTRRDRYSDITHPESTVLSESRMRLIASDLDGTHFHFNWDMLTHVMKVTVEPLDDWLHRVGSERVHPAFDPEVLPHDPLVAPTEAKLAAFSTAISVILSPETGNGPGDR